MTKSTDKRTSERAGRPAPSQLTLEPAKSHVLSDHRPAVLLLPSSPPCCSRTRLTSLRDHSENLFPLNRTFYSKTLRFRGKTRMHQVTLQRVTQLTTFLLGARFLPSAHTFTISHSSPLTEFGNTTFKLVAESPRTSYRV